MTQQDRDEIRALVLSFSTRISDLPEVVALADGDYITVVQNDGSKKHSKKATLQSLLELIKVYYPDHNGAKYQGIAHPSDANVILPIGTDGFWVAIDAGIYTNYGGITVGNSPKVIKYNATTGEWTSDDLWGDINGTIAFRLKEGHAADSLDTYRIPVIPNRDYVINADCLPAGSLGSVVVTEFNYEGTLIKRTELESVPLNFIPQSGTDYIQVTLGYNHSNPIAIEHSEVTLTSSLRTLVEGLYNFLVDVLQGEYEARFDSLEGDISSLFSGLSSLSDAMNQGFGGLGDDIQAIIRRLTDDEGNIAELILTSTLFQTRLSDAEGNISTLRQTADEISAQVENAQGDIARLQIRADEISTEVRNAEGDISRLSQRADQIEATVTNQQGDISRITQRADLIETSVSDIEGRTSTLEQTAEHIQTTVVGIQGEMSQITQRADSIESTVAGLEGDMSRITQRADSIESAVVNLEGDVSQITQRADSIESTVSAIDGRTSTLEQRADGFDLTVTGLNEDIAELELTAQGLSVAVQNANNDIAALDVRADEISASVQDANQNIASLEIRADGIESQVSAVDGRVSTVEQTANGLTVTVSALDGRVSTVEQTADGLVSTVSNLSGQVSTISQEVDRIDLAVQAVSGDLSDYEEFVDGALQDIQNQIDGAIDTWFYDYAPVHTDAQGVPDSTVPLTNVSPYSDWLAQEQQLQKPEQVRDEHVSDIFYDTASGYAYRFVGTGEPGSRVYSWVLIEDSAVIRALEDAARAQDTADNKRRVFLVQPTPPYDAGDLWVKERTVNGVTTREIYRCIVSRASGVFVASDWGPADDYATTVNKANIEILADAIAGTVSTYQYDSEGKLTSETKNLIKQTANDTVLTITGTELQTVGIYIHNASPSDNHIDLIADKVRIKGTGDHTPTGLSIVWDSTDQRYKIDAASLNVTGIFSTSAWSTQLTNINNTAQGYANTAQSNAEGYADGVGTAANSYADQAASDAETAAKAYADNVGSASVTTAENYFNNIVYGEGGSAQQPTSGSILYTINNLGIDLSNLDDQINDTGGLADQIQTATQGLTDLGYLAEALLNGETVVAGGLIVSSLIQLGSKTYDGQDTPVRNADGTATPGELNQNTWKVWSGLNGVYTQSAYGGGIAAWYGGAMLDRYYSGNTDANRAAKSLFRFDGSGYLAKKNIAWEADGSGYVANNKIAWDTSGNLTVDGYVLTNEVQLKDSNSNIKAGISGAYNASATGNGIASWWGGEKLEKSVWDASSASYKAAHEYARSLFRMDGSGYLANNNISWDAAGNLDVNGFVLTNEIQLKDSNGNVKAGISGRYNSSSRGGGLATWYGGPKVDHIDSPSTTPYALTGFRFDGTGYLADGKIRWDYDQSTLKLVIDGYVLTNEIQLQDGSGNIQAGISGAYDSRTVEQGGARGHGIAAWYGGPKVDHLQYPSATDYASSLFRMDGSGYLAGGELQWGASGELIIHGQSAENPITIENAVLSQGSLSVTVSDLIALKSWFTVESWTDSSGTHSYLKLNASGTGLEGFVSDGFISAGGLSPGSGSGGADLPAVWTSLRNVSTSASEINNTIKINALHIPIGTGLDIQNGLIVATNSGTVTGVSLAQGATNGTLHLVVNGTAQSDVAVTGLGSMAYETASNYVTTSSGYYDTVLANNAALDANALTSERVHYTTAGDIGSSSGGWSNFPTGVPSGSFGLLTLKEGGYPIQLFHSYYSADLWFRYQYYVNGTGKTWVGWKRIWNEGNDGASSGLDADLLDGQHGSYYATASSVSTLQGYFTNGVANSAAKLTTVSKTAWGQTYWTSGGVPTSISGDMSSVGKLTFTAKTSKSTSGNVLEVVTIDGVTYLHSVLPFVSDSFISAGGVSSGGGSGGIDADAMWGLLANTDSTKQINAAHLSTALSGYLLSSTAESTYVTLATAQTISGLKTFTSGLRISGRAYSGGDDEGIVITWASNLYATLALGSHNAERSVFTIHSGEAPRWVYNNGTTGYAITHPAKNGTIALTSDIPNVPSWALASTKPSYTFAEITDKITHTNEFNFVPDAYDSYVYFNYRSSADTAVNVTKYIFHNGSATTGGRASVEASSFIKYGGTSAQFLKADGSVDSSTYLTGNQTITLSGDVSGSGATSITTTIGEGKVTNAMLAGSIENSKLNTIGVAKGGTGLTTWTGAYRLIYSTAATTVTTLAPNTTTTRKFLRQVGANNAATAPAWDTVTKTDVGLSNVENTALSTWAGTNKITTLGTITTGVWNGSAIGNSYLANSSITINGSSTSLGGSFSTASITAGTAGQSGASTGVSFSIPYVTMNKYGIVTAYGTHTHTISASDLTTTIGSTTYAPYNSAGYLPLTGGTMSGTIKWGTTAHNTDWTMSDYGIRTWNGYSTSTTIATGAPSNYSIGLSVRGGYQFTLAYNASGNILTWRPGDTSNSYRTIWDSGNSNLSTVAWACSTLTANSTISAGLAGVNGSFIYAYQTAGIITASSDLKDVGLQIGPGVNSYGLYSWVESNGNTIIQSGRATGATRYNILLNPFGGNIGIGTAPSYKLDVYGTSGWTMRSLSTNSVVYAAHNDGYGFYLGSKQSSSTYYLLNLCYGQTTLGTGGTSAFYVRADGRVGIGTSSPGNTLDVNGSATYGASGVAGSLFIRRAYDGNATYLIGSKGTSGADSYTLQISNSSGNGATMTLLNGVLTMSGNIVATGAITAGAASDARLKTNISTLSDSDAKALIMALRPVTYTWNDKATELYDQYKGDDLGFVAQEVENVLPVAIGTIFEKYMRLDQTKFIAPLVAVAKDHETRIEKLEKEVKARDAKIVELESEIKRLRMN